MWVQPNLIRNDKFATQSWNARNAALMGNLTGEMNQGTVSHDLIDNLNYLQTLQ